MNFLSGLQPYANLLKLAGAIAALLAAMLFGWQQGAKGVKLEWETERAQTSTQTAIELEAAYDKVRTLEAQHQRQISAIDQRYQDKLKENTHAQALALSRARAGGLRIDARCPNPTNPVPATGAPTGSGDGTARAQLSVQASEFLIALASEADQVVEQLTACQAILKAERP